MVSFKQDVENHTLLIHHLLKLKPVEKVKDKLDQAEVFCNFWEAVNLENGVIKNENEWSLAENVSWLGGAKKMFIRDCYKRDADELLGEPGLPLRTALILGPKGIGKTMFLNYLIVRIRVSGIFAKTTYEDEENEDPDRPDLVVFINDFLCSRIR